MIASERVVHDVFVSYVEDDRAWVVGALLDALTRAGVRFTHEVDFNPSAPRLTNVQEAVISSKYTVLVVSPSYLNNESAGFINVLAVTYGLDSGVWPVIPLRLGLARQALPPLLATLEGLDAADPESLDRLCRHLGRRLPLPPPPPPCPYPGMRPFAIDAENRPIHPFHGRELDVDTMVLNLRAHPFLCVIGPSGSGKSSLVAAGLVPVLRRSGLFGDGEWLIRSLRPGEFPAVALAETLDGMIEDPRKAVSRTLAAHPATTRFLLIVDQFEEVFTSADPVSKEGFLTALRGLSVVQDAFLVIVVRADFYDRLMGLPADLWSMIGQHHFDVLPLGPEGLHRAIVSPAEARGVRVDPLLIEKLIADVEDETGSLPFLQEALVLIWEKLQGRYLSLAAYEALVPPIDRLGTPVIGGRERRNGLQAAVERHANAVMGQLTEPRREIARRIFLRMTEFGQGNVHTRRQRDVDQLVFEGVEPSEIETVLQHLATNRLITLTSDENTHCRQADIAHESLIAGWRELRQWIGQRLSAERLRRQIEVKAAEWSARQNTQRGGGLLDRDELAEAERWANGPEGVELGVDPLIRELILASRAAVDAEDRDRAAARKRLRRIVAASGIALVVAVGFALATWVIYGVARHEEHVSRARQLIALARADLDSMPQRSAILATRALQDLRREQTWISRFLGGTYVPEAEETLRKSLESLPGFGIGRTPTSADECSISVARGLVLTEGQPGVLWLWNLTTDDLPGIPAKFAADGRVFTASALSEDGRTLAATTDDEKLWVWDTKSGRMVLGNPLPIPNRSTRMIRVANGGRLIATAEGFDGEWSGARAYTRPRLLDLDEVTTDTPALVVPGTNVFFDMRLSPEHLLITTDKGIHVFNPRERQWSAHPSLPFLKETFPIGLKLIERALRDRPYALKLQDILKGNPWGSKAWSQSQSWMLTNDKDKELILSDLSDPDPVPRVKRLPRDPKWTEGYFAVDPVAVSDDGKTLVLSRQKSISRQETDLLVYRGAETIEIYFKLGSKSDRLAGADLIDNGRRLVVRLTTGEVRVFDLDQPNATTSPEVLISPGYVFWTFLPSADGRWIALISDTGGLQIWRLGGRKPQQVALSGVEQETGVAVSPDGFLLATGSAQGVFRLWDIARFPTITPIVSSRPIGQPIGQIAFVGDHGVVTGNGASAAMRYWTYTTTGLLSEPVTLLGHRAGITSFDHTADGRTLATTSPDETVRLWDLSAANPSTNPTILGVTPEALKQGSEGNTLHRPNALKISPDGKWLAIACQDGRVRLWDRTNLARVMAPKVLHATDTIVNFVGFSANGRWLVSGGSDSVVRLWDLTSADPGSRPTALYGPTSTVNAIAISRDGRSFVAGSTDSTLWLWDLNASMPQKTGRLIGREDGTAYDVIISSDSKYVYSYGLDHVLKRWVLEVDDLLAMAPLRAGRNLDAVEWAQFFPGEPYQLIFNLFSQPPVLPTAQASSATPTLYDLPPGMKSPFATPPQREEAPPAPPPGPRAVIQQRPPASRRRRTSREYLRDVGSSHESDSSVHERGLPNHCRSLRSATCSLLRRRFRNGLYRRL